MGGRENIRCTYCTTPEQVQYKHGHIVIIITELRVHNLPLRPGLTSLSTLSTLSTQPPGHSHISLVSLISQHQPGSNFHYCVPKVTFRNFATGMEFLWNSPVSSDPLALQEMRDLIHMERDVWSVGERQPDQLNKKVLQRLQRNFDVWLWDSQGWEKCQYCRKSHSIPAAAVLHQNNNHRKKILIQTLIVTQDTGGNLVKTGWK